MSSDRVLLFYQANIVTTLTSLNFLSMLSNFLASSGNCERMSPPMNILSRYIHFRCTSNHTCATNIFTGRILWISVTGELAALTHLYGLTDKGQVFFPLLYGAKERSNKTAARHAL